MKTMRNPTNLGGAKINLFFRIFKPGIAVRIWYGVCFLAILAWVPFPVRAQASDQVVEKTSASYKFGSTLSIQARIRKDFSIGDVYLFIQPQGQDTYSVKISPGTSQDIAYVQDIKKLTIRPFSTIIYWFQILTPENLNIKSNLYTIDYKDDRFQWLKADSPEFEINWYGKDPAFGQQALDISKRGLQKARSLLPGSLSQKIQIYLYNSSADLQAALSSTDRPWVAGHASPDLGIILATIPSGPEQRLELERQLPHEIMHVIQYSLVGEDYPMYPTWLMEGLASTTELYPNAEYNLALESSAQNRTLLSMESLCSAFPGEASDAYLAYAQSASFVQFLHSTYGTQGILKLLAQYKNGLACDTGVMTAFGTSLNQLETRWRQKSFQLNPAETALRSLTPYLALIGLIIFPFIIVLLISVRKNHSSSRSEYVSN